MVFRILAICLSCLAAAAWLTGVARKLALSHHVLDMPNERSSHSKATPRGGGVAMVLTVTASLVVLCSLGALRTDLFVALIGGSLAVATIGFVDDRRTVRPGVRLAVHLGASVWAVSWLGGLPALRIGEHLVHLGWMGYVLAVLGIGWTLNLFNFMDGIDGIAASEAAFIAWAGALLTVIGGGSIDVAYVGFVLGAACMGFLLWNWPPAKIFMGDVGSGYLGYLLGTLALAATRDNPAAIWIWLVLGGVFFVDATVTLARRLVRAERVYEAHRSHAYQWLARRWGSHRRVTLTVMALNLLWLMPWAVFATIHPDHAIAAITAALSLMIALALVAGSGKRE